MKMVLKNNINFMQLVALALIVLASCNQISGAVLSGVELQGAFEEIDKFLTAKVKVDDVESNLEAANQMLDKQNGITSSESLVQAIKLFTSLKKIKSEHKCNSESHKILADNIQATGRDIASKQLNRRRIDEVVYQSCVDLAKHCLHVYPERLQRRYDELDSESSELVDTLNRWFLRDIYVDHFDQYYLDDPYKNYPIRHHTFLYKTSKVEEKKDAQIAIRALTFFAESEPERKCLYPSECDASERRDKVGGLYEKYLKQRCQKYVNLLGPEILFLANFDSQFYTKPGMTFSYDPEQSYYQGWARFRFCDALVNQKQDQLLKQIIDYLEDAE